MKILMLTPYLPYPLLSGGQIRTYNLLKKLAPHHEITLFSLIKDESERQYLPELESYCKKIKLFKRSSRPFTFSNIIKAVFSSYPFLVVRNYVPETIKAIEEELSTATYDLIHAETFYMMPHLPHTQVPTILVEQTIEYLGYESYAAKNKIPLLNFLLLFDINKIKKWEHYYWESCDRLIVMSPKDKQFISAEISHPEKIAVVANGVDAQWFGEKPQNLPPDPTVLSVGTFKWLPNVEAVKFLVEKVWPLIKKKIPQARLWIVGNAPTKEISAYQATDKSITITGGIPDIRDAFKGAHVLLAPVFSGKGTRYKILEAMASETPIVGTEIAVEGLGVAHDQEVLIGNTAEAMAKLTISLLENSSYRQRLAKKARRFVTENYDWDSISQTLDKIYRELGKKSKKKTV